VKQDAPLVREKSASEIAQKCLGGRGLKQLMRMIRRRLRKQTKVLAFMLTSSRVQSQPKEHAKVVLRAR
jgi:hypothetical protein